MKITTLILGNNKIEFNNSFLGVETIKVNDTIVSNKLSIFGTEHNFTINEDNKDVTIRLVTGLSLYGFIISLYKDDVPIIQSNGNSYIYWICIIIFFLYLSDVIYQKYL